MDFQQSKYGVVKPRRLDDMDVNIFTIDVDVGSPIPEPNYQERKEIVVQVYVPRKECIDANTGVAFSNGDYMYIYSKYDVFNAGDKIKFQSVSSEQGNMRDPIKGDLVVTKCSEHNIYIVTNPNLSSLSIEQGPTIVNIVVGDVVYNQSGVIWSYDERDKLYRVHTSVDISTGNCKVTFHDGSQVSCDKVPDSSNCISMVIDSKGLCAGITKQIITFENWKSKIEETERSSHNLLSKYEGVKRRRLDDLEYADEDGNIFKIDVDVGSPIPDPNYQETIENVVPVYVPRKKCIDANTGVAFSNGDYVYIYTKYDVFNTGDKIKFKLIYREQGNMRDPIKGDLVVTKCSEHNIYIVTNPNLSSLSIEQGPTVVNIVVGDMIYNQSGIIWSYDERDKLYRVHTSVGISTGDCKVIFHDGSQVSCDKTPDSLNCITMVIDLSDLGVDIAKQIITFENWKSKIEETERSSEDTDGLSRKSSDKTVHTGVENNKCMLNLQNIQIEGLIQDGADINSTLYQAVENNNENIVKMFIDDGCDVNIQNKLVTRRRLDDMEYAYEDENIFTRDVDVDSTTPDPNYQETKENVVQVYVPRK